MTDAEDKLDALAQGISDLHEDVKAIRATVEGRGARFDAIDGRFDAVDGGFKDALDKKLVDHGHLLAEILRRLPAE